MNIFNNYIGTHIIEILEQSEATRNYILTLTHGDNQCFADFLIDEYLAHNVIKLNGNLSIYDHTDCLELTFRGKWLSFVNKI